MIDDKDVKIGDYIISGVNRLLYKNKIIDITDDLFICRGETDGILKFERKTQTCGACSKIIMFLKILHEKEIRPGDFIVSKNPKGEARRDKITICNKKMAECADIHEKAIMVYNLSQKVSCSMSFKIINFEREIIEQRKEPDVRLGDEVIYKNIEGWFFTRKVVDVSTTANCLTVEHNSDRCIDFDLTTKISTRKDFIIEEIIKK